MVRLEGSHRKTARTPEGSGAAADLVSGSRYKKTPEPAALREKRDSGVVGRNSALLSLALRYAIQPIIFFIDAVG